MNDVEKHLSRNPKDIFATSDDFQEVDSWFYEQASGFYIVVSVKTGENTRFIHIEISWRTILASVGRYLKSKGKKIVGGATLK